MTSAFRSFRFVNYRIWFAAALVSNIGTWMQRTAQDWIVLTVLTDNDAAAVGVTMALQFGPQLLLAPIAGLVTDLIDRRRLLMMTQAAMGALSLGLGILTVTGLVELWMVYAFALALGIVTVFDAPARNTFVNELVPVSHLSNAVALNATSFNTARVIGPALAGLLTASIDTGPVFLINAASFAATIFALTVFRQDQLIHRIKSAAGRGRVREGVRYVLARSDLRLLFTMVFLMGMLGVNFPLFISTMASTEFERGATEYGVLSSIIAVGSVAGALFAARRERARLRYIVWAAVGFGASMLLASVMPSYWTFAIVLPFAGITSITFLNTANAYVQTSTPSHLQGRVISLYMAVLQGGTPIGAPLVGAVTNAYGPRWGIVVGALGGVIPAGLALVWWLRRRRADRV